MTTFALPETRVVTDDSQSRPKPRGSSRASGSPVSYSPTTRGCSARGAAWRPLVRFPPVMIFGLQVSEGLDGMAPALRPATAILRTPVGNARLFSLAAFAEAALTLCVALCHITYHAASHNEPSTKGANPFHWCARSIPNRLRQAVSRQSASAISTTQTCDDDHLH